MVGAVHGGCRAWWVPCMVGAAHGGCRAWWVPCMVGVGHGGCRAIVHGGWRLAGADHSRQPMDYEWPMDYEGPTLVPRAMMLV